MKVHKYTTTELVAQKPSKAKFKKLKRHPLVFILHNIRSLENVGLFFRLADAIRAEKIYLTGYTGYPRMENDIREERIIAHAEKEINKTAIKVVPFVPWSQNENVLSVLSNLRNLNYQLVGVEQTDQSLDYQKANYKLPVALLFGHERTGVEENLLKKCDLVVHIPMLGLGNSHNVAMAGTIISYDIIKRLRKYGKNTRYKQFSRRMERNSPESGRSKQGKN